MKNMTLKTNEEILLNEIARQLKIANELTCLYLRYDKIHTDVYLEELKTIKDKISQ